MTTREAVVIELQVDARRGAEDLKRFEAETRRTSEAIERTVSRSLGLGNSFDRLRARVDPAIRAQIELNRAIAAGDAAFARGRASLDDVNRTIDLYRQRLDAARAASGQAGQAIQLNAQQLGQIQFQLSDLATGLLSGQSPFMVLQQQGSQLAQMFASGTGVTGALRAVGQGLITYLTNPLNIAVLAFAGLATGAAAAWAAITQGGESAADVLERSNELIRETDQAFDRARESAAAFNREINSRRQLELSDQLSDELASMERQLDEFVGRFALRHEQDTVQAILSAVGGVRLDDPQLTELAAQVEVFLANVEAGVPTVTEFANALGDLGKEAAKGTNLGDLIRSLIEAVNPIEKSALAVDDLRARLARLDKAAAGGAASLKAAREETDRLASSMANSLGSFGAVIDAVATINNQLTEFMARAGAGNPLAGPNIFSTIIGGVRQAVTEIRGMAGIAEWTQNLLAGVPAPGVPIPGRSPFRMRDLTTETEIEVPIPRPNPLREREAKQEFEDIGEQLGKAMISGLNAALSELLLKPNPSVLDALNAFTKAMASAAISGITQGLQQFLGFGAPGAVNRTTPALPALGGVTGFAAAVPPISGIVPLPMPKPAAPALTDATVISGTDVGNIIREAIIDGTSMAGMTPQAMAMLESAAQAGAMAGLTELRVLAAKGGGHLSHSAGTEFDVRGFVDGQPWSLAQRLAVAEGAALAGGNRFGFYPGGSLHMGLGYGNIARNAAWGPGGLRGIPLSAFNEIERPFVAALRSGGAAAAAGAGGPGQIWTDSEGVTHLPTITITPEPIEEAVRSGTQQGFTDVFQQGSASPAAGGRMQQFFQGPAGQGLMAGLGGFSIGFQNQSPIMGALGGGLSGLIVARRRAA